MRAVGAVLFAIATFLVGWFITGLTMVGIAVLAYKAGGEPGVFHFLITWLLGPAVGGYLAIHVTHRVFPKVALGTVFVSFVTLASVFAFVVVLSGVLQVVQETSWAPLILGLLQCAAIILGAYIAGKLSEQP